MPILNDAENLNFGGEQVLRVNHRGVGVWVLPVPVNTVAPVVSGGTSAPADLSCSTGTWTNTPSGYTYQWQENISSVWTDMVGETANTLDDAPAGTYRCMVTASNSYGSGVATASNSLIVTSGVARVFGFNTVPPSDGGFPGQANRALASKFTKSHAGRITQINFRLRSDTEVGANGKIVCHADDAGGTVPGTRLWISGAVAIPAGATIQTPALPTSGIEGTDAAGTYWLVFVPDNFQADIAKSNTLAEGQTRMANGTYSYASPPSSWPGTDGTYDGPICVWCDYIG